jgi:leucyl aminopeptidase
VEINLTSRMPDDADVVALPAYAGDLNALPWSGFVEAAGFTGTSGETIALPGSAAGDPAQIVYGLGAADDIGPATVRRAAAGLARAVRRHDRVAVRVPDLPFAPGSTISAIAEGLLLGGYRFTAYKSSSDPTAPDRVDLVVDDESVAETDAVVAARRRTAGVLLARDLGNEPGGVLTPTAFAGRAEEVAASNGLTCEVWDEDRIAAERLGGLLGVSRGSAQPPRLVVLRYEPAEAQGTVALVGKGVTFDSGGLTIKTNQLMLKMKIDMAGAAAVLGACSVLRDLDVGVRVTAWLPLTDNMSGGDATRLGDVLRTRNGTTVEVRNADAEGRLILADALALAAEERPDAIVDVATLTDGIPVAIGGRYAGLTGNHPGWIDQVADAAGRAGELVWQLPLCDLDRPLLDSKIADLVNEPGKRYGQSASAALFLREFVGTDLPWAHLDMAGPAFVDDDDGEWTAGATGFGVLTLLELLTGYHRLTT